MIMSKSKLLWSLFMCGVLRNNFSFSPRIEKHHIRCLLCNNEEVACDHAEILGV